MGWQYYQRVLVHSDLFYTTSLVEVQSRSDAISHTLPICHVHQKPVLTGFYLFKLARATEVDAIAKCQMSSGKFHC